MRYWGRSTKMSPIVVSQVVKSADVKETGRRGVMLILRFCWQESATLV